MDSWLFMLYFDNSILLYLFSCLHFFQFGHWEFFHLAFVLLDICLFWFSGSTFVFSALPCFLAL